MLLALLVFLVFSCYTAHLQFGCLGFSLLGLLLLPQVDVWVCYWLLSWGMQGGSPILLSGFMLCLLLVVACWLACCLLLSTPNCQDVFLGVFPLSCCWFCLFLVESILELLVVVSWDLLILLQVAVWVCCWYDAGLLLGSAALYFGFCSALVVGACSPAFLFLVLVVGCVLLCWSLPVGLVWLLGLWSV